MATRAELQDLRDLRERRHRDATGRFPVEGEKVGGELLAAGHPFLALYATPAWTGDAGSVPLHRLSPEEMARVSHFPTPSPVLAVAALHREAFDPAAAGRGLTLVLDGVQDPGNVGTLLRIADWFGLARVLLSPDCADPFHPKVVHASMGSFARVRAATAPLAPALAAAVGATPGLPVLGCDLGGASVHALPPLEDALVVIGAEGRGLSPEVRAILTARITIPRRGSAESLNAAVAAGIVCAALRRS
ncbi:MAG: TrmH family RNA methyltransferase [Opitutaceae bacterium]